MRKLEFMAAICSAALLALGCGSTSGATCDECSDGGCGDSDTDSDSDSDSDSDGDTDWECPDPIAEACPDGTEEVIPPLLAEASDFGEGTRFVDVSPWTLLAERDAVGVRTISVIQCGEPPCTSTNARIASIDLPIDSDPHAIAVETEYYEPLGNDDPRPIMAAVCGATGCALYGADFGGEIPDTELTAVPGGEIPGASIVHGLWWRGNDAPICAYGDGIHCFDGTSWTSLIQANPEEPLFNDMEIVSSNLGATAVAVGDSGRLAFSGFPDWSSSWGDNPDWLAVHGIEGGFEVAGEDGAYGAWTGGSWHEGCAIADKDVVLLVGATVGATASGRLFAAEGPISADPGACYTGEQIGAGVRGVGFMCGIATNLFLMDATTLYGTTDCWID